MVKGYQNLIGRALVALRAIERCADARAGYRVVVYAASPDEKIAAELLAYTTGLEV